MQSESWVTSSSLSFFKYTKLKGPWENGWGVFTSRRPVRKLAAISKRGKSIHICISKAACDVKQNPFSHDFKNMAMLCYREEVEGHSEVGEAGISSSYTKGGDSWMERPLGVGLFGPGFKFWLHHSTNCATWGKFCVTSPNQYEIVISISTWSTFQGDFKIKSSSSVRRRSRVQLFRALRLQPRPETEVQLGHFFVTLEQPLNFLELRFTHPWGSHPPQRVWSRNYVCWYKLCAYRSAWGLGECP